MKAAKTQLSPRIWYGFAHDFSKVHSWKYIISFFIPIHFKWSMNFKHFFGKQNSKEMQNSIKITAFSWKAFDLGIKHFWMVLQSLLVENEANNPILLYCGCCPFQVDVAQETGTHMDLLTILKSKVV